MTSPNETTQLKQVILNDLPVSLSPCPSCGTTSFRMQDSACEICKFVEESKQALALRDVAGWIQNGDVEEVKARLTSLPIAGWFIASTGSRVERKTASKWRIRLSGNRWWSRMMGLDEMAGHLG